MITQRIAVMAAAVLLALTVPAVAQDARTPMQKGVTMQKLVTSLGGFNGAASLPVAFSGHVVTIEPGGQTGRERNLAPSYVYVLEGTLTTNTEGGPIGVNGYQYTSAGQSYMDPVGIWHNHMNNGMTAVRYLELFVSAPGATTVEMARANQ